MNAASPHDPTTDSSNQALLIAANELSLRVGVLTEKLDVSSAQARETAAQSKRTRTLAWVIAGLVLIVAGMGYQMIQTGRDNAKQNCRNANESRAGSLSLWTTVLDYTAEGVTDPVVAEDLNRLQVYVAGLYAPRDCDDLSKEYKVPPAPVLGG